MLCVISPHLDDSVLSIGRMLAAHPDALVLTALAGLPTDNGVMPYDESCGFDSSLEAVKERRRENRRAMDVLEVAHYEGPWLDGQYGAPFDPEAFSFWLCCLLGTLSGPEVLAPLGIHHPDHIAVGDATRASAAVLGLVCHVYEELPYRVWWPEETAERLSVVMPERVPLDLPRGSTAVKRAAVECYRSQVTEEFRESVYVPERIWSAVTAENR